jgi:hypothetical protein
MFYNPNESFTYDIQNKSPYSVFYSQNPEFYNQRKDNERKTLTEEAIYINKNMGKICEEKPQYYNNFYLFESMFFNNTKERNKYLNGNLKEGCKVVYYSDVKDQIDNSGARSFSTIINTYDSEHKNDYFKKFMYLSKNKEIDILPYKFKKKIEKIMCFELFFRFFYTVCFFNYIPKLVYQSPRPFVNLIQWAFGFTFTNYVLYFIKQHYYKASFKMLFENQSERNILLMLDYYERK